MIRTIRIWNQIEVSFSQKRVQENEIRSKCRVEQFTDKFLFHLLNKLSFDINYITINLFLSVIATLIAFQRNWELSKQ